MDEEMEEEEERTSRHSVRERLEPSRIDWDAPSSFHEAVLPIFPFLQSFGQDQVLDFDEDDNMQHLLLLCQGQHAEVVRNQKRRRTR